MIELHVSPAACDELAKIWSYIARHSQTAADRHQTQLYERMLGLVEQPMLGPARPEYGNGVRALSVGEYVILYEITPSYIFVMHVIHGAQDIASLLRRPHDDRQPSKDAP